MGTGSTRDMPAADFVRQGAGAVRGWPACEDQAALRAALVVGGGSPPAACGAWLPRRGHCSADAPIAGLLSRGRERDLPGAQAVHPVPLPRSRTPAESTIPRLLTVSSMLPPLVRQRRLQRINHIGAIARLQHLLPTLQEWCCHHPCKARFRLAGSPLPGGSRTLWITTKGFRSHSRPPLLDLSWRNVRRVFPNGWKAGFPSGSGSSAA